MARRASIDHTVQKSWRILARALALTFALFAAANLAFAAEPPSIFFSASDSALVPFPTLAPANATDPLWLALSPGAATSDSGTEVVCVDGSGDELCGYTLVLETQGDLYFESFCQTNCAPGLVHFIDPTGRWLRINQVGIEAAGSAGPLLVGDVRFSSLDPSGTVAGFVYSRPTSEAVGASLQLLTPRPDTDPVPATFCSAARIAGGHDADGVLACALPEPGTGLMVTLGALAIAALGRQRCRRDDRGSAEKARGSLPPRRALFSAFKITFTFALALAATSAARAQLFGDETAFRNALSGVPLRVGFESVPLGPAGFAAARNGDHIGPVELRAPGLTAPVNLAASPSVPLGLFGTMLVADPGAAFDPALFPGGTAPSADDPTQDDDLRILFRHPVQAAGFRIRENVAESGEAVLFLDAFGDPIVTVALPSGDGFVGFIREPGDAPIAEISILESADGIDDIGIDEILALTSADPYADAVVTFSPVVENGEPAPAQLDPAESLGAPDSTSVSLGEGGVLVLRFLDHALTGSGNPLPDLRIFESGLMAERVAVEISGNGLTWHDLGFVDGGTADLDLDLFGFGTQDLFYFIRLTDDAGDVGPTGPARGADIDAVEALSFQLRPLDGDADGVPDDSDVCPSDFDERQGDEDFDGVGDVCDNCRWVPNPGQLDSNADGIGDACNPARVELVRDFTPFDLGPVFGQRLANIRLDCGGLNLHAVTVGIWVPPGVAGVSLSDCEAPPAGEGPPGAPVGAGCPAAFVGATVDPARSGAFGVPLGIGGQAPPTGFRSDVVYLSFRGQAGPNDLLCSAGQTDVPLARMTVDNSVGLEGVVSFSIEDAVDSGWCALEKANGDCADPPLGTLAMLTNGVPAVAELLVRPALSAPSATAHDWEICLSEDTAELMHRVTMGLLGPNGATDSSLALQGCEATPTGMLQERDCSSAPGDVGPFVDEGLGITLGPVAPPAASILAETLYTPLEGAAAGPGGTNVLNELVFRETCLAVFTNDPPAVAGAPPIPVRDGFDYLEQNSFHDAPSSAYQTIDNQQEANLAGEAVYETLVFNEDNDIDGDGIVDSADNCPFFPNADQLDSGGFGGSPVPDGRGDACECGDANGSGLVAADEEPTSDLQLLREYLVGMQPPTNDIAALCSVTGDTACDSADLVVLERALRLPEIGIEARCDAAVD